MTGLANRALFLDRVDHALRRATRATGHCRLLFIDLDDFKSINDGMGHGADDELLRRVADRIRVAKRSADTVARLGGDEFALLVEDLPPAAQVRNLAELILQMLRAPVVQGIRNAGNEGGPGFRPSRRVKGTLTRLGVPPPQGCSGRV